MPSGAVAMERTLGPSSKPQLSVVEQLKADQDVMDKHIQHIIKLNAAKAKRERDEAALRRQLELAAEREAAATDDDADAAADGAGDAEGLAASMAALQEELELAGQAEDYLEVEQVLFPVVPKEPSLALDDEYAREAAAAAAALGMADLPAADGADSLEGDVFRQAVLCGMVRSRVVARRECGEATARALFALLARSPDAELAGAAFAALLTAMGDPQLPRLMLDAVHVDAAPADVAPLAYLPSCGELLEALQANGYDGTRGRPNTAATPRPRARTGPGAGEHDDDDEEEDAEERVQAVKLLLHTGAAVCRYAAAHPGSAAAAAALPADGLAALLTAVLRLHLDPCADRLQPDLAAATAALLGAFDGDEWARARRRQLADAAAGAGPSARARLRLLRALPAGSPRGLELQQLGGCLLVEGLIPGGRRVAGEARRSTPDPTVVISSQPWFGNPKGLAAAASAGPASRAAASYSVADVELLLRACDDLLWPHILRAMRPGGAPLELPFPAPFMAGWLAFLAGLHRSVRGLQPEEVFVRTLANQLELQYKYAQEGPGGGGAGPLASP